MMIATPRETTRSRAGGGTAAAPGAADVLCLAAAPCFAIMALLALGAGAPDPLCSVGHAASPLGGMVPMYALMSAFHAAPWLKLIARRQRGARQSRSERRHRRDEYDAGSV